MTLAEIAALLEQNVHDGKLVLRATMFTELAAVLDAFGVAEVQLDDARATHAEAVVVDGRGALLGSKVGAVHLDVRGTDTLTATLAYTAPPGWRFADGVPRLPGSYKHLTDNGGLVGLGESVVYDLSLASATVTATSPKSVLDFRGTLTDAKQFTFLEKPLGLAPQPALAGTIQLAKSAAPKLDLAVGGTTSAFEIGTHLRFADAGLRAHTVDADPSIDGALTRLDVDATLQVGATNPVAITLSAPFYKLSGMLELTADFGASGMPIERGVAAFAELLGLDKRDFELPDKLRALGSFALLRSACVVQLDPATVHSFMVTVGPQGCWKIADGVEIGELAITWTMSLPFDAKARSMSAAIDGKFTLGRREPKVEFAVDASSWGGFTVEGHLVKQLKLAEIVAAINGAPVDGLPELDVVAASVSITTSGDFDVLVELANWKLSSEPPVELFEVCASVGRGSGTLAARFYGVLGIGGARLYAASDLTSGRGWEFRGGLSAGATINLTDAVKDLQRMFGVAPPAALPEAVLSKLDVQFSTKTKQFTFDAAGTVTLVAQGTSARLELKIDLTHDDGSRYAIKTTGTLTIDGKTFTLALDNDPRGTVLLASYTDKVGDVLDVREFVRGVSHTAADLVPTGLKIGAKEVAVIAFFTGETRSFAVVLDLNASLSLSSLPVIGDKLPPELTIAIDGLLGAYSTAEVKPDVGRLAHPLLPPASAVLVGQGLPAGVTLGASAAVTGQPRQLKLPIAGARGTPPRISDQSAAPSSPGGVWLDVQKQLGPVHIGRIGAVYHANALLFVVDASVAIGPLSLSMEGLGFGSPLDHWAPTFELNGLGIGYASDGLEISGAFLRLPPQQGIEFQFDGAARVKFETIGLAAIGSYAQPTVGQPSLFLFAQLTAPLGGPPEFFVTGLMGGFGFNRELSLPRAQQVTSFPLLALGGSEQTPSQVLDVLEGRAAAVGQQKVQWIAPRPGVYWLAVGLEFTTYELLETKALLVAEFGRELVFSLLGTSAITLPKVGTPYLRAALGLAATLKPTEGSFSMSTVLSPGSFVLDPACRITGGFALATWFGANPHAGQFVLTIGGYHPAFRPPPHFPVVDRLGFNWPVSSSVTIKGGAYLALTTSSVMAGGDLEATYADGNVSAWFTATADVLVSWKPFFFTASIDVSIGVAYRINAPLCHKTISASVRAKVALWGPPTGGEVYVHLWCVSFTVSFGPHRSGAGDQPLGWDEFEALLPATKHLVTAAPGSGLAKMLPTEGSDSGKAWVMRAGTMSFTTRSAVPASKLAYDTGGSSFDKAGDPLSIRPMNRKGVTSTHTVTLARERNKVPADQLTGWTFEPLKQTMPDALWGAPPSPFTQTPGAPAADIVANQLVGYRVTAPPPRLATPRGVVPIDRLGSEQLRPPGLMPLDPQAPPSPDYVATPDTHTIEEISGINAAARTRNLLVSALTEAKLYKGPNDAMTTMARDAAHLFSDPPLRQG